MCGGLQAVVAVDYWMFLWIIPVLSKVEFLYYANRQEHTVTVVWNIGRIAESKIVA